MQTPAFITHRTWWAAGRKRRAELLIITRGEQQTFINGLLQSDGAWPTRCVWLIQTRAGSMCDTPGEKNPTHTHTWVCQTFQIWAEVSRNLDSPANQQSSCGNVRKFSTAEKKSEEFIPLQQLCTSGTLCCLSVSSQKRSFTADLVSHKYACKLGVNMWCTCFSIGFAGCAISPQNWLVFVMFPLCLPTSTIIR